MSEQRTEALKQESIPQLLRELSIETTTLVRQEIELAKTELNEKTKTITASAVAFAVAAVFALGAFAAFTTLLIALLAEVVPVWAAALIVLVIYAVVAAVAAQMGRKKIADATPVVPQQAAQSVKEDIEWVKTRAQSSKR